MKRSIFPLLSALLLNVSPVAYAQKNTTPSISPEEMDRDRKEAMYYSYCIRLVDGIQAEYNKNIDVSRGNQLSKNLMNLYAIILKQEYAESAGNFEDIAREKLYSDSDYVKKQLASEFSSGRTGECRNLSVGKGSFVKRYDYLMEKYSSYLKQKVKPENNANPAGVIKPLSKETTAIPTKKAEFTSDEDICIKGKDGYEYCKASKGKDIYGLPKPIGWIYRIQDNGSIEYEMLPPRKVNVKGSTNRYFEIKKLHRYYSQGRAGTPPQQITIGSQSTNCSGNILGQTNSYTINCTTSPENKLNLPGREAEFPGIKQKTYSYIVDCKDKTFASFYQAPDGTVSQLGNWQKAESKHTLINQRMSEYCSSIQDLSLSTFSKYAE